MLDISQGGARLEPVPGLSAGDHATLIFEGLPAIAGKVTWIAEDSIGIRFDPANLLQTQELREILSGAARAA